MGRKENGGVMQNYEFKLTPAYCLYNGAAIVEQNGAYIKFITESEEDSVLRLRLEKAFMKHIESALKQKDCSDAFKRIPKLEFVTGTHEEVRNYVSKLFIEDKNERNNEDLNNQMEIKHKREAAAIVLLDSILDEGRKRSATDIHIENNFVRMRIKGKLENYASIQTDRAEELILRIKLLSGMNVLEKRKSQDGHFVFGDNNPVFVRVSVMAIVGNKPEENEESVVLRLLDTRRLPLGLSHLGFSDTQLKTIEKIIEEKNGLVLICGPTGSGKSTTAASMLMERIRKSCGLQKIISLEDPPEYLIPGVTQIKIDKENGNTFEKALENVFRQDPDVLMIGEIRDELSARVALRASLTGHLVIATLHTDSAEASVLRLKDLGCKEELIDSVLRAVMMQELSFDINGNIMLLADVATVNEGIFTHVTNVPELIRKTGKLFRKKLIPLFSPMENSEEEKA